MNFVIDQQAYGKSRVRLTRVRRDSDRHELTEFTVQVLLDGDFDKAYTHSDNRPVVATDTVKNTVFALGRQWNGDQCEEFANMLAKHFISTVSHVDKVEVEIKEHLWQRLVEDGKEHDHAFCGSSRELRTCKLVANREQIDAPTVFAGIDELSILKTTASGFSDFYHDGFTTLKDTDDRIFATVVHAHWQYKPGTHRFYDNYHGIRKTLLHEISARFSPSVQATLYEMATAVLNQFADVDSITLKMPNQHRLLMDLSPMGMDNPNLVFIATDEPHGTISATIKRSS